MQQTVVYILLLYVVLINLITVFLICTDKKRAINGKWRIREHTLFLFAFLGGTPGALLAMVWRRHKIKKPRFLLPMLFFLLTNSFAIIWITGRLINLT